MTKQEYLDLLYRNLKGMSEAEKSDIVAEYENHFVEGFHDGKSEQEMIESLGDPIDMARRIKAEAAVHVAEEKVKVSSLSKAVVTVLGLSILNFFLILGPLMLILGLLFGLGLTGLLLIFAPGLLLFKYYGLAETVQTSDIFATVAWFGLGLILVVLFIVIVKWCYIGFIHYLKWNIRLLKKGDEK